MQMQSHPMHENAVICTVFRIYKGGLPHSMSLKQVSGQVRSRELPAVVETNMKPTAAADFDVKGLG
jgi:hypothetical protein